VDLASFFIREASNDVIKCEFIGRGGVEGDDGILVRRRKAGSEDKAEIFIRDDNEQRANE